MRALPLLLLAAVLAGCGSGAAGGGGSAETLRVFAAASLTGAFTELGEQFEADHPGTRVELNFGPSSGLSEQIASGAPADVFASADTANMDKLTEAGLNGSEPVIFATNRLAIIVAPAW